jgi:hypothetical protein
VCVAGGGTAPVRALREHAPAELNGTCTAEASRWRRVAHLHRPGLHQQRLALPLPRQVGHARHAPPPGFKRLGAAQPVQNQAQAALVRLVTVVALAL